MEELDRSRASLVASAMGEEGDLVALRLARGCRCFAVLRDGAITGYGWLSAGPEWIGEVELEITPRPGEAYVWNCVTLQPHRRRGVFRSLLLGITAVAHGEGLRRLWIGSVAIPAERAVGPAGFRPALHFTSLRAGPLHLMRIQPSAEPDLAREALGVVATRPGVHVRRGRRRRH